MNKDKPFLFFIFLLFFGASAFSETVVRRDGLPSVEGIIVSGGKQGLLVEVNGRPDSSVRIPWSNIDYIAPFESRPLLQLYLEDGENLWRAKLRFARGDIQLAEPLFQKQFDRLASTDCEDSLVAAEGLLRVLIARGALQQAVLPWFEVVRLYKLGYESPFKDLEPIIDDKTGLCFHLPVMVLDKDVILPKEVEKGEFVSLLNLVASNNQEAIEKLEVLTQTLPSWQIAWAHYSLAVAVLHDKKNEDSRTKGLLHLSRVASLDPSVQPWLTGAAMLRLSEEMMQDGFLQQATRIADEAIRLFPSHPLVLDYKDKRKIYE